MAMTFEGNFIYYWSTETIGSVLDNGDINLREIRGFHHNSKVTWDVFLDPSKRYSFTVTYENGRWAPNLLYLNKVAAGVRLLFY